MKWIISNERTPNCNDLYFTEDSEGARGVTEFNNNTWYSQTGHPIAKWVDEALADSDDLDEVLTSLTNLVEAVPNQDNDHDWWPDSLTQAMHEAKAIIAKY